MTTLKTILCSLILVISFSSLAAQDYIRAKSLNGKNAKRYANALAAARQGDFATAEKDLLRIKEDVPNFFDGLVLLADIEYDRKNHEGAAQLYQQALSLSTSEEPIVLYRAGLNALKGQSFAEAAEYFQQFLDSGEGRERTRVRAQKYLANAQFSAEAYSHPVDFNPTSIGENINTDRREYLPAFTADGEFMIYTANIDGQEDFYYSQKDAEGNWLKGRPMNGINTPQNEGAVSISADGRLMIYTACNRRDGLGKCDLYFSRFLGDRWSTPQNMGPQINQSSSERQPSLSADGRLLYFSSDRSGGKGGYDIWISKLNDQGQWSKPINIGAPINTNGNEEAPFLHSDGQSLYFMSDGHPSLGGYDLYLSRRQSDGWQQPKNLGYPINTTADEGALTVSLDGKTAYYSTNQNTSLSSRREGLRENIDIYQFPLYEEVRPQAVTYVRAKVLDANSNEPLARVSVDINDPDNANYKLSKPSDENGQFLIVLPAGRNYSLRVSEEGYLFYSDFFALQDSGSFSKPFELTILLQPIPEEELAEDAPPIVLRNVFFATASAELDPRSESELMELKRLLDETPKLKIRINGHTDNVGSPVDNLKLSEARAKAVHDFLLAAGISPERLSFRGFGETMPIATNETEAGRAQNRRTEFQLIQTVSTPD